MIRRMLSVYVLFSLVFPVHGMQLSRELLSPKKNLLSQGRIHPWPYAVYHLVSDDDTKKKIKPIAICSDKDLPYELRDIEEKEEGKRQLEKAMWLWNTQKTSVLCNHVDVKVIEAVFESPLAKDLAASNPYMAGAVVAATGLTYLYNFFIGHHKATISDTSLHTEKQGMVSGTEFIARPQESTHAYDPYIHAGDLRDPEARLSSNAYIKNLIQAAQTLQNDPKIGPWAKELVKNAEIKQSSEKQLKNLEGKQGTDAHSAREGAKYNLEMAVHCLKVAVKNVDQYLHDQPSTAIIPSEPIVYACPVSEAPKDTTVVCPGGALVPDRPTGFDGEQPEVMKGTGCVYPGQLVKLILHFEKHTKDTDTKSPGKKEIKKEDGEKKERVINQTQKTEFLNRVKKNYQYDKSTRSYKLKDNGTPVIDTRTGKPVQMISWDGCHGDVEAWASKTRHMGSIDPNSLEMYKGPSTDGRTLL